MISKYLWNECSCSRGSILYIEVKQMQMPYELDTPESQLHFPPLPVLIVDELLKYINSILQFARKLAIW
jgi:hypothetical protein